MSALADLGLLAALWTAVVAFVAGVVRGYSGFGFAAIILAGTGLVANPILFVPVVVIVDLFLTLGQAPSIRGEVDWRRVRWLGLGSFVVLPFSVWVISNMGVDTARLVISVAILAATFALWTGVRIDRPLGRRSHLAAGLVSGTAQGASLGGLPVAVFFAAQNVEAAAFRATIIAFFFLIDLWALPWMFGAGMVTSGSVILAAYCLPFMALGVWYGTHRFRAASPEGFRRFALFLLGALALGGIGRSLA